MAFRVGFFASEPRQRRARSEPPASAQRAAGERAASRRRAEKIRPNPPEMEEPGEPSAYAEASRLPGHRVEVHQAELPEGRDRLGAEAGGEAGAREAVEEGVQHHPGLEPREVRA